MSVYFPRFALPVILHPIRSGAIIAGIGFVVGYYFEYVVLSMSLEDGALRIAALISILLMTYLLILLSLIMQYLPEPPHGEKFIDHIRSAAANDRKAYEARQNRIKSERTYQHRSK